MLEPWNQYAKTVIASMREVLSEANEEHHPLLLEVADYWLALGITLGLERPEPAGTLLSLAEPEPANRAELEEDAEHFANEALS